MKKNSLILILLAILSIGFASVDAKASSLTIATFADPSGNNSNPLFTADFAALTLNGGWSDAKTGLTLQIPYSSHTYSNAWFNMNSISLSQIVSGMPYYNAGAGAINFYKDGTSTNPLLTISFSGGFLSPYGFGGNETLFTSTNVTITGSEITDMLSEEQFAFSFANTASFLTHPGFTATASFTSSATVVPEPATIGILCLGGLAIFRKKKHSCAKTPQKSFV